MRTRKKLSLWASLPPYLGGKRRLCPLIFREVDRVLPRRHWPGLTFLDAFLGGGSVALYAKAQGFRVMATDIAERAITVGQALIANSRVKITWEDVLRLAAPTDDPLGRIETGYVPRDHPGEYANPNVENSRALNQDGYQGKSQTICTFLSYRDCGFQATPIPACGRD